jgi:phosphotransferase system enzyme I (PtsI)
MAGDPAFTEVLLAMGLRSFSMHPSQISAIKQRVLRADVRRWAARLEQILRAEDPQTTCLELHGVLGGTSGSAVPALAV